MIGTEEHPVRLTSLKEGWRGLSLSGLGHTVSHTFMENAFVGIHLQAESSGTFEDLILQNTDRQGTGVLAESGAQATFERAVAKGFREGFRSNLAEDVIITDSTITDNQTGVVAQGEPSANVTRCGNPPTPPNRPFRPDPIITYSDIYGNQTGILVNGDQVLLQVEKTNITNNTGLAMDLRTAILDAESYIRSSNIINNAGASEEAAARQVTTYHRNGELQLGGNYWFFISDPELSDNWHSQCNGMVNFSGFEPELIGDAGPRLDDLTEDVKKETWKQQQQGE